MKYLQTIRDLLLIITCVMIIDTCRLQHYYYDDTYEYRGLVLDALELILEK